MQLPSPGRVVRYVHTDNRILVAIITEVVSEHVVNLAVFDTTGAPFTEGRQNVPIASPETPKHHSWHWPSF